jgi:flagellar basal body-associated protein FliL
MAAPASDKNDGSKTESSGGIKAMLPLILNIVLLPVMAFAMTQYVLLPRLNKVPPAAAPAEGDGQDTGSAAGDTSQGDLRAEPANHPPAPGKGGNPSEGGGHGASTDKTEMLDPVTVNVAGTMGSRLLMAKIGIRGSHPKLEEIVKARSADLRDAASSLLYTKTLMDIERQGARVTIKAELKNAFQRILGNGVFTEVVMPDLAVQ